MIYIFYVNVDQIIRSLHQDKLNTLNFPPTSTQEHLYVMQTI